MLITILKLARLGSRAFAAAFHAFWRWQQQRKAAAELHIMSDYSLRDIGVARSQIDARVRLSSRRYVQPTNSNGLS